MSEGESLVARTRQFVDLVQQQGQLDLIDEYVAPTFRNHSVGPMQGPGREDLRSALRALRSGLSNVTVDVVHCVSTGNIVATHKVFRGVHTGDLLGIPPTQKTLGLTIMDFVRYNDAALMEEHWAVQDVFGALQQLDH